MTDSSNQESDSELTTSLSTVEESVVKSVSPVKENPLGRASTAGSLARLIVKTFCLSVGSCIIFAFLILFMNHSILMHNVKALNQTKLQETENKKELQNIEKHNLEDAWELFKNFGAIMAGPLGFVLGFYFRETSND